MDDKEKKFVDDELKIDSSNDTEDINLKNENCQSEANDNESKDWEFDGNAPTLDNDISLNEDFSVEVDNSLNAASSDNAETEFVDETAEETNKKTLDPKTTKIITTTVLSVLIIIGLIFAGVQLFTKPNAEEKMNPGNVAVTVGDTKVSVGMYNFCYNGTVNRVLQQHGAELDLNVPFSEQTIIDSDGNSVVVEEFFKQETLKYLQTMVACYEDGVKEGITLTSQQQADIDNEIQKIKEEAHKADIAVNEYTQKNYGEYCGLATYKKCLEQQIIAAEYSNRLFVSSTLTNDDVDKHFNDNLADYQEVEVGYYALDFDPNEEGSKDKAIADAQNYCSQITDLASFEKLIPQIHSNLLNSVIADGKYDSQEEAIKDLKTIVETKIGKESKSFNVLDSYSVDIGGWAFDSNNKINSCTHFVDEEYNKVFIVFKMSDPKIDDAFYEETYGVRHILITPKHADEASTSQEFTQEEWDAAKTNAQSIYDQFKNGDQTELSFAFLAEEFSDDPGSTSKGNSYGGIFEDMFLLDGKLCTSSNGQVMGVVDGFSDWVIEPNRKQGDTGIVQSKFGYHIMYFMHKEPIYITRVRAQMIYDEAQKEIEEHKVVEHKGPMAKTKVIKIGDIK